jgi:hypothetical protein
MKISQETVNILKNFATINTNLLFRAGNTVATINAPKSIFAKAQVKETFPKEVAIYDLNSLLQLLTFADDQEVEFGDKSLTITNDIGRFEYFYCDSSLIIAAPTKDIEVDEVFKFSLTAKDVQTIIKTVGVLAAPTISIVGKNGKVTMKIGDRKNDTANSFNKVIGETESAFECNISSENFKLMQDAYECILSKKLFCQFKNAAGTMTYLVAMEPGSTI